MLGDECTLFVTDHVSASSAITTEPQSHAFTQTHTHIVSGEKNHLQEEMIIDNIERGKSIHQFIDVGTSSQHVEQLSVSEPSKLEPPDPSIESCQELADHDGLREPGSEERPFGSTSHGGFPPCDPTMAANLSEVEPAVLLDSHADNVASSDVSSVLPDPSHAYAHTHAQLRGDRRAGECRRDASASGTGKEDGKGDTRQEEQEGEETSQRVNGEAVPEIHGNGQFHHGKLCPHPDGKDFLPSLKQQVLSGSDGSVGGRDEQVLLRNLSHSLHLPSRRTELDEAVLPMQSAQGITVPILQMDWTGQAHGV